MEQTLFSADFQRKSVSVSFCSRCVPAGGAVLWQTLPVLSVNHLKRKLDLNLPDTRCFCLFQQSSLMIASLPRTHEARPLGGATGSGDTLAKTGTRGTAPLTELSDETDVQRTKTLFFYETDQMLKWKSEVRPEISARTLGCAGVH